MSTMCQYGERPESREKPGFPEVARFKNISREFEVLEFG